MALESLMLSALHLDVKHEIVSAFCQRIQYGQVREDASIEQGTKGELGEVID